MTDRDEHDPRDTDEPERLLAETTAGCALLLLGGIAAVLIAIIILVAYTR